MRESSPANRRSAVQGAASGSHMISLEKIRKAFGGTVALDSYSLTVPHGETTVLIGPSGCGKSTVIRIITGLVKPDEGTVSIHGQVLTPQNILEMRRRMGYVIQDGGLFPHLTARQNVVLMAEYLGRTREYIEANLVRLAALTKLPLDSLERFPLQLSGGQNQRVSLMRALMLDPEHSPSRRTPGGAGFGDPIRITDRSERDLCGAEQDRPSGYP